MIVLLCLILEYLENYETNIISNWQSLSMERWHGLMTKIFVRIPSILTPKNKKTNQTVEANVHYVRAINVVPDGCGSLRRYATNRRPHANRHHMNYKPDGYPSVSSYLIVSGANETIEFVTQAFGVHQPRD